MELALGGPLGSGEIMTRFKLIPTRGRGSRYVRASEFDARAEAELMFAETEIPVLVVEHPEGGLIRRVCQIGQDAKPTQTKRAA